MAAGNALGPTVAAALWARRPVTSIKRLSDVLRLIFYGALGTGLSALIGPAFLVLARIHAGSGFVGTSLMWWVGDMMGVVLVVPLVLNFSEFKMSGRRLAELALLVACLLASSELLSRQNTIQGALFGFGILPFIIWGAARFSIAGAALSSFVVAAFAIWETSHGDGPFLAFGSLLRNFEALQIFMGVLSISGLCLAAVIAERTKVEEALAREEQLVRAQERYRMIVETTNEGVWVIDAEYKTSFVNQRTAEMLGYTPEEMLGRSLFDFQFPEDVPKKQEDMEKRRRGVREVLYDRIRRKDGSELWALVATAPIFTERKEFAGVLAMWSDVTVLRRTEEALRRNEKLITAGRLAATISHEVNNPLAAVVNLLYLLKSQPMGEQAHQYVDLLDKEVLRISAITRRTLGFFRDAPVREELPLADLLDDTLSFYEEKMAAHSIKLQREYRCRGTARVSRGELQQVFANLISNALDAMNKNGVLTLRITEVADKEARHIRVGVEDTGPGIAEPDLKRIFEPFFTTKPSTGTGLGLWVAKEIIEKHGGTIAVSSEKRPGGKTGTRFAILLPACDGIRAAAGTGS